MVANRKAPHSGRNWRPAIAALSVAVGVGLAMAWYDQQRTPISTADGLRVPELSPQAQRGRAAFAKNCAACHGATGGGSENGPPLVHRIYEPGHHGDGAFRHAIAQGARAHHWKFGDMPAQPQVTAAETAAMLRFVRDMQQANGIF